MIWYLVSFPIDLGFSGRKGVSKSLSRQNSFSPHPHNGLETRGILRDIVLALGQIQWATQSLLASVQPLFARTMLNCSREWVSCRRVGLKCLSPEALHSKLLGVSRGWEAANTTLEIYLFFKSLPRPEILSAAQRGRKVISDLA